VAADPHEIANVLGPAGVAMLAGMCKNLPLRVLMMAPSTVPSAPGYETSGAEIDGAAVTAMLGTEGVAGLGEVMDFNGVIAGDKKMLGIIDAAKAAGVFLDGHVPTLRGKELQAFTSTGIDCDHTYMDAAIVKEKLENGMWVQIQERFFSADLMAFLNNFPVQNRITLVTDDVPITRLAEKGHLGSLVRKAIALGLDAEKAIRYVTINAADRLRLYYQGAISPGWRADILLLRNLKSVDVSAVFVGGRLAAQDGAMVSPMNTPPFPAAAYHTMHLPKLSEADFAIPAGGEKVTVNAIWQDGATSRTRREQMQCTVKNDEVEQGSLVKMTVFERHSGRAGRSHGLIANLEDFRGALATTYAHDCHNLAVYSSNDSDAALAANTVTASGGGVAAVLDGKVLSAVALPIAGILCEDSLPVLAEKFRHLTEAAAVMKLNHTEVLTFLTLMPLAVSPEFKLTDRGLVDVLRKRFVPLIELIPEGVT
jgi:adenine deaminase